MSHVKLDPYLFFTDNKCREAMEFYHSVFGGTLDIKTFGDMGGSDAPEGATNDGVMHAYLSGGDVTLMASDSTREEAFPQSSISLSLTFTDETKMRETFAKLSEGGKIDSEIKEEVWGDLFGAFTDKYGTDWMTSMSAQK